VPSVAVLVSAAPFRLLPATLEWTPGFNARAVAAAVPSLARPKLDYPVEQAYSTDAVKMVVKSDERAQCWVGAGVVG
jgi:hypothetical protein